MQRISAFIHSVSTHDDTQAKAPPNVPNLATVLPENFGWTTSSPIETVVTAAVVGGRVEIFQELSSILGEEMQNMLEFRYETCCHC